MKDDDDGDACQKVKGSGGLCCEETEEGLMKEELAVRMMGFFWMIKKRGQCGLLYADDEEGY